MVDKAVTVSVAAVAILAVWLTTKRDHTQDAFLFVDKGEPDNALRSFESAAKHSKGAAEYHNLGAMLYRQKLWTKSLDAYGTSLTLNPNNMDARETFQEIRAFIQSGGKNRQKIGTIPFKERHLARYNIEDTNANHVGAALYHIEQGDFVQASKALKRNLDLNPTDGRAYNDIATLLVSSTNADKTSGTAKTDLDHAYQKAWSILEKANTLNPDDLLIQGNLKALEPFVNTTVN
jgi:tetratricopeptide (TPR) repeat protein